MRILITNDDGVNAPGLMALSRAATGLGNIIIAAPKLAVSGCAHSTTTDRALHVERCSNETYAVDGTSADCVRIAFHNFETPFDWVLSGINHGGNLGVDAYYSGTVAAVREAALYGVPGIAISQYHNHPLTDQDWERAATWADVILKKLTAKASRPGTFWNVNLPSVSWEKDLPNMVFCSLDPSPLPLSFESGKDGSYKYNGKYSHRQRQDGSDVDVCFRGSISVTEVLAVKNNS
jgi:5'-nucleotidase